MLAFGMPMGPIELIDMVGLDVAMAAGKSLAGTAAEPPKCLLERFNAGHLGKKSGRGFYDTPVAGRTRVWRERPGRISAARLLKPLLERTQQLVNDGVVADADLADAGVIFGGPDFAPFTGGPLKVRVSMPNDIRQIRSSSK
jgi:3-hydroxyacyl-CoA dehydrogenase/enoyl-CoA hydratase/3-hydroxybutyryl-CoA epimerase